MVKNILTIDVEDYFQVENFKSSIQFSDWPNFESRIEKNTEKVLGILDETGVKVTFFILGWTAEKFPELVKKIHRSGHEIASHGYAHELIYNQSKEDFRSDLRKGKKILEDIIQEPVFGYRAPSFSITKRSRWALDILIEDGFAYDSSVFPIHHDHGGLPDADREPHRISSASGSMWEFPISTMRLFGQNIPFSGGGYLRLLPYAFLKYGIRKVNAAGIPAVVYLHPWELDPGQPRIASAGRLGAFRHYVHLSSTEGKLKRLLSDFEFSSVSSYIKGANHE